MSDTIKSIIVTSGAMFALIFGAGNLILPPQLGARFPDSWPLTALGFTVTAIVFPVLGFVAHARNQQGISGLARPMGKTFSWLFPLLIYLIAITLPSPRTASVTYEVGIRPLLQIDSGLFSLLYFAGVFLVGWFRGSVLQLMGKFLNPLLLFTIVALIGASFFLPAVSGTDLTGPPFVYGLVEGYQTYDALASMVIGGVVLVSFRVTRPGIDRASLERIVLYSGLIAGTGLLLVYWGLIFGGSHFPAAEMELPRTELLRLLSARSLGGPSVYLLSALVGLACFSTACGVSIGAADFTAELVGRYKGLYYRVSLGLIAVLGWLIGMWEADTIVNWGYPILLLVYPATVVLIVLSLFPADRIPRLWFRLTLWICVAFSVPDVLVYLNPSLGAEAWLRAIPGSEFQLGWVLPSILVLIAGIWSGSSGRNKPAPGR